KIDYPSANKKDRLNGGQGQPGQKSSRGYRATAEARKFRPTLEPEASTTLREQLTAELQDLNSSDEAANWAHQKKSAKNSLAAADAERLEQTFQKRLASIADEASAGSLQQPKLPSRRPYRKKRLPGSVVDKSVLALAMPRRIRDRDHVKSVAKHACLICGRRPADAHHLRFAQSRALGRKASDEFTVPLCRGHHREAHRCGDEADWWKKTGIDPIAAARTLWLKTHPLPTAVGQAGSILQNEPNLAGNSP